MLSIIAALCENNAIGKDNKLLCHISDDLRRFRRITSGKTLIMGMNTFISLPKVLPGRKHIVLTRNKNFNHPDPSVIVARELEPLVSEYAKSNDEAFIIGGASVYEQTLPYADKLYLTVINKRFDADAFFPAYDINSYYVEEKSAVFRDEKNNADYYYLTLTKHNNKHSAFSKN